ncbi:multidrug effflux MFS transporter [Agarivorans sp. JK6]|uniref:multidrug effflux MFS transporter n=1 Tax=Agarivorans sp. JK6 TaxID=2997426 RepID=UPI00387341E8
MQQRISKKLIILLASVFAMTPYAIDSYLPAIPIIATDFGVSTSLVAITVSIYVFGMALGQLIGGPLSDKYGRKPIMVIGLLIFAVCSVFLALANNLALFWLWRILQSIGGGIAVVGVPAVIRDNAEGKEAAKLFSLVMLIMMIAPSIAPSVGTFILQVSNWHWIFISSGIFACVVAIWAIAVMPIQANTQHGPSNKVSFIDVLKHKHALGYLISQAFAYGVLMTFITNAPFAYIVKFGISEQLFSMLFIANVVGVVIVNRYNSYRLNHSEPEHMLVSFLAMQFVGAAVLVASIVFAPNNLWFAASGFIICMAATGGTMSNANVCFLKHFGKGAGTAQAVLGAIQFFAGAAISAVAAMLSHTSLWPMVLTMLASTTIALLSAHKANILNQKEKAELCCAK